MANRVLNEHLDYLSDGLYYFEGKPFTGIMEFRSSSGVLEAETECKDGQHFGVSREWDDKGVLIFEANYRFGLYHGLYREWDSDGQLVKEDEYELGIRIRGKEWNEDGDEESTFEIQESDFEFSILLSYREAFRDNRSEL